MNLHLAMTIAAGLMLLPSAKEAAGQGTAPQYQYRAAWIALATEAPVTVELERNAWTRLFALRPERGFRLEAALVEAGKRKPRLEMGTILVGMKNNPKIACRLERPQFDYNVECVQDAEGDGRYEGFFLLNHDKPFLFTASRQPRQQKVLPADPVVLTELTPEQLPLIDMVLLYSAGSAMSALGGTHRFQFCVLRPNDRNIWGDKTHDRGCLPDIVVKDQDFPKHLTIFGRTVEIAALAEGKVLVSVAPFREDVPVAL